MNEKNSQNNKTQLLSDNLDKVEKLLEKQKLYSQLNAVKSVREMVSLLEEIENIVIKYYPVKRKFTDIQSALVYLLDERSDEIHDITVKYDLLQEQLDIFKNKEV